MREIPLTRGYVALVDDADYERLSAFKWCAVQRFNWPAYAVRRAKGRRTDKRAYIYMHQEIMGPLPAGLQIDHADRNGLNNQRANLRVATPSQNSANRSDVRRRICSSRFRGVTRTRWGTWQVAIKASGTLHRLGTFKDETAAAQAYDTAARAAFGEFATLNFPKER